VPLPGRIGTDTRRSSGDSGTSGRRVPERAEVALPIRLFTFVPFSGMPTFDMPCQSSAPPIVGPPAQVPIARTAGRIGSFVDDRGAELSSFLRSFGQST
jgi:hypothetical protein